MNEQKIYLSLDEQISLLKSKNLIIPNESSAKTILKDIGYYKLINAYKIPFIATNSNGNDKKYINGITIEHLYDLFKFDLELESITFEASTKIEIRIKSLISEVISSQYGTKLKTYLRRSNFSPDLGVPKEYTFVKMRKFIKSEIQKQLDNNHPAITWYFKNYNDFPFWVIANILTLGSISKIFSKMKESDQILIAKNYKLNHKDLVQYIKHINMIRNICAHNDVLYRFKVKNNIPQKLIEDKYNLLGIEKDLKTGRYKSGTNDLMSTIIVFNLLLDKQSFNNFKTKLLGLMKDLKNKLPKEVFERVVLEMGLVEKFKDLK